MVGFLKKSILSILVFCLFASILIFALSAEIDETVSSLNTEKEEAVFSLSVDSELYYGRSRLAEMDNSENLLKAYDKIFDGVEQSKDRVILGTLDITVDEINIVLAAYRFDNPQHFWFKTVEIWCYGNTVNVSHVDFAYIDSLNTVEVKEEFNSAVQAFLTESGVNYNMSEYEISKILHDAVADHITYVNTEYSHNVYGALIEGKAVCEGYAELYQYLLYIMGIQSHIVTGTDLNNQSHAWNLVRIDGEYYQTDITWDDQGERIYYAYFNTTTEYIKEDHIIDNNGYPIPECTATNANFFNHTYYNGKNFLSEPSVKNAVTQLKYYGTARFFYNGNSEYTYNNFTSWVNNNISNIGESLGLNGFSYSKSNHGREFWLKINDIKTTEIPQVDYLPELAAAIVDTGFKTEISAETGAIMICPSPSVDQPFTKDSAGEIINNSRIKFTCIKDDVIGTGCKVSIGNEEASIVVKGDIDGDGLITVFDAMMIKKAYDGENMSDQFTDDMSLQKYAADIDNDNAAEEDDVRSILSHVVGKSINMQ